MGFLKKLKNFILEALGEKPAGKRRKISKTRPKKRKTASSSRPKKKSSPRKNTVRKKTPVSSKLPKPKAPKKKIPARSSKTIKAKPRLASSGSRAPKTLKKTTVKPAKAAAPGIYLGAISHYFPKVKAAVIPLEETLQTGARIAVVRNDAVLFRQAVKSIQINRIPIDEGRPGEEVGLEVLKDVAVGDKVYRL